MPRPSTGRAVGLAAASAAVFAAILTAPHAARAQSDEPPSVERLRPPALIVRPEPGKPEVALEVASVAVKVEIAGDLAVTTLDLTFRNPNDRVLEGRFVVPLPHGASPSRFAMQVGEEMREGVVVTKEKARVVFETIVRRGVDPGLLEWVKGNAFQARVYPIPAKGTKRVIIGYEAEVDASAASWRVPLGFDGLTAFRAEVAVRGPVTRRVRWPTAPGTSASESGGQLGTSNYDGRIEAPSARLADDLVVDLGPSDASGAAEVWTERRDDGLYFVARVPVKPGTRARPRPKHVTVFWDASGSREQAALDKERALIAAFAKGMGDGVIRLIPFSDERWPIEGFGVKAGDAGGLVARLAAIEPDGGTRLGAVALDEAEAAGTDLVLLFSDGLETLARGAPEVRGRPVIAIASSSVADHARLAEVAGAGNVIDLGAASIEQALAQMQTERVQLLGGRLPSFVKDTEPRPGAAVTSSRFTLAGRLESGFVKGEVELDFGYAGSPPEKVTFALDGKGLAERPYAARIWARKRVQRLLGRAAENEVAIQELGRRFSLVTPFTSMLVLETLEDHIRYEVPPPPGPWQDAYFEAIEGRQKELAKTRADKLAKVREMWKQRVAWWETTFEAPPPGWRPQGEGASGGADAPASGGEGPSEGFAEAPRPARRERMADGEPSTTEASPAEPAPEPTAPTGAASPDADEERARAPMAPPASAAANGAGASSGRGEAKMKDGRAGSSGGGIELKPWTPDQPYLKSLEEAGDAAYERYLALKGEYAKSPAFFLDVADWFGERRKDRASALRVLSNLAELDLESAPLLRVLAHRYRQLGALELAAAIFADVRRIRPEEPQSHRDLGLVLADLGRFEEAIPCLEAVVLGEWDGRFPEVELVALGELNQVIARCKAARGGQSFHTLPDELIRNLDVDVRIVLSWDADQCDMDLWVVEPTTEKAFYSNTRTRIGGWFGRDFTGGYGPEEYLLKKAIDGRYKIQVNYYGSRQQEVTGATTIQVEVIRNYGRPDEVRQAVTRRLATNKEVLDIADVTLP